MATTVCADGDQFETDGTGKLQLKTGCGVEFADDGSGLRVADTLPWPFDCDMEEHGGRVYCDPASGLLRTAPPDRHDNFTGAIAENFNNILGPGDSRFVTHTVEIDTSEHCFDVAVQFTESVGWNFEILQADAAWLLTSGVLVDDIVTVPTPTAVALRTRSPLGREADRVNFRTTPLTLTPGVHTLTHRLEFTNQDATATIDLRNLNATLTGSYTTRRP